MIFRFNNNVIVRLSEVVFAYTAEKEGKFCIHLALRTQNLWLDVFADSEEEAEKEVGRLMKAMEADIGLKKKPKKRVPRRKIR